MTVLIPQPPRIDLAEITTDQTGKLRAKITRPWSMYFEAIFDRIGGNVASTPDDIEQGQLARVHEYVVSLETSLSMISAESQRVHNTVVSLETSLSMISAESQRMASELDALRLQPNPAIQVATELDALLSQPTPSSDSGQQIKVAFTPQFYGTGGGVSGAGTATGIYTLIGKLCFFSLYLSVAKNTLAGAELALVGGATGSFLPRQDLTTNLVQLIQVSEFSGLAPGATQVSIAGQMSSFNAQGRMTLIKSNNAGGVSATITVAEFADPMIIRMSGCYLTQ